MSNIVEYRQPESCHWWQEEVKGIVVPRHDATLREARKEGLSPSVTSVLSIKAKPQLQNWLVGQLLAQALTMTRYPNESDYAFIQRVKEADEAERAKAPDLGTAIHAALAQYITTHDIRDFGAIESVDMTPALKWIDEHVGPGKCEVAFCSELGFGGCIDYVGMVDLRSALIDWKSSAVKRDKQGNPAPVFYDDWGWQLAAYAHGGGYKDHDLWSVIVDTAHPGCYVQKWEPTDIRRGWNGFQGLLEAWIADRGYDPRKEPF